MISRHSIHFLLAAILLALTHAGAAGDRISFAARDGRVFQDVTVRRVFGRKLEVMTPTGVQVLRYTNLPHEVQERFFDPSLMFPPKIGDLLDFKTLDGKAFKGPLRRIAPDGISIETPDGLEKINYSNLPPELANTFDYDAEDAARYQAALRAARQRALAAEQLAAQRAAAAQREADQRAAAQAQAARSSTPSPTPDLGKSGSDLLGVPRLGGRGLGK